MVSLSWMDRSLRVTVNFWDTWNFSKKKDLIKQKLIFVKLDFTYKITKCPRSWQLHKVIYVNNYPVTFNSFTSTGW